MMSLNESEIHIWQARSTDFDYATLLDKIKRWLSPKDLERLERFYFEEHKKQLLLGRYLLRKVLSLYSEIQPSEWEFSYNDYGKPAIAQRQQANLDSPLYFNLSHSKGVIILAVSRIEEMGVDIECNIPARRVEKIAHRYFSSSEIAELKLLDESAQHSRFYDLWSLKEAYIKACGLGLAIPLRDFSYQFLSSTQLSLNFASYRDDNPKHWQLWQLKGVKDFNIALAAKSPSGGQIQTLKSFEFKDSGHQEFALEVERTHSPWLTHVG